MRYKVFFILFLCLFLTGCQARQSNLDNEIMLQRQEDPFNDAITSRLKSQLDPLKNAVLIFSDPVVEAETRDLLDKPEGDILLRDVLTITNLYFYRDISTLTDLKWFTNLESIILSYGKTTSLEGIEHLINLKKLVVTHNNISSLEPVSNLINLEVLVCNSNNISSLDPLSNLINLKELNCDQNNIEDFSALSGLTNLEKLSIGNNGVTKIDLSVFESLTKLKSFSAPWCGIDDISVLSHMPDLEFLNLYHNNISDINRLKSLEKLTYLNLNSNQVIDISAIENFNQLEFVYLGNNPIPKDTLLMFLDTIGLDYDISYQSVKINNNIPEFDIEIFSYFEENHYKVQTLTISNNTTGEIIQTIFIPEISMYGDTTIDTVKYNHMLSFEDLNFDGYTDIRLDDTENGNYLREYIYLVWNPELGLYQNDKRLNDIPMAYFNQEEQLIYGLGRATMVNYWYYTYKYIDGEPTLISELGKDEIWSYENIEAYIKTANLDIGETDIMVFHEIVTELNEETGEMETIRDEYVFYPVSDYINEDAIIARFDASSEIGNMISADQ